MSFTPRLYTAKRLVKNSKGDHDSFVFHRNGRSPANSAFPSGSAVGLGLSLSSVPLLSQGITLTNTNSRSTSVSHQGLSIKKEAMNHEVLAVGTFPSLPWLNPAFLGSYLSGTARLFRELLFMPQPHLASILSPCHCSAQSLEGHRRLEKFYVFFKITLKNKETIPQLPDLYCILNVHIY